MSFNLNINQELLSRVYPLINIKNSTASYYEQYLREILSSDVKIIQIRAKNLEIDFIKEELIKYMQVKNQIKPAVKLIINDYVELGQIPDGVHLGQDDECVKKAREKLGPDKIIGLSTHNLEQVKNAPQDFLDYLAIGPIFNSKTKSGHRKLIGLDALENIRKNCSIPLVAIGGINSENAKLVFAKGVDSVAVISDILDAKDPVAQIRKYS